MQLGDCPTDGETKPGAVREASGRAPLKAVEQSGSILCAESGTIVLHYEFDRTVVAQRCQPDGGTGRGVLCRVVEKVRQKLHDQLPVDVDQRKIRRDLRLNSPAVEPSLLVADRGTDQLLQGLPCPIDRRSRLQTHEI